MEGDGSWKTPEASSYPITGFRDGEWQEFTVAFNELAYPKEPDKRIKGGEFMSSVYLVVTPAEGRSRDAVAFMIDDCICWDGDPVWNAAPAP